MQNLQNNMNRQQSVEISPSCPGCGAHLEYCPDKEMLSCDRCTNTVDIPVGVAGRFPLSDLSNAAANRWDETRTFICNSCSAQEVVPAHQMTSACAFCGGTNIAASEEIAGLKPNAVVPFKISKAKAVEAVTRWAKKKALAPSRFKKNVVAKDVDGIYTPAFKFDATTFTQYQGVLSRVETRTTWVGGRSVVTSHTVRFPIRGTYSGNFNNMLVHACDTIGQADLNKIQPYAMQNVKEFNSAFLYGFVAGQNKRDGLACWGQARGQIDNAIRAAVLAQHPGCSIVSFNANTQYTTASYRYVLIPVFVGHFNYRGKLYQFFINGESGKITGKTPKSPLKIGAIVAAGVLALGGIIVGVLFGMGFI